MTETDRIENMNRPNINADIKIVIKKKFSNKQNSKARWFHRLILPNVQRRANAYPAQTLPQNYRERKTPKLILLDLYHPDTKMRHSQKRKLQANITDEHIYKNPQQNSSKQTPITH